MAAGGTQKLTGLGAKEETEEGRTATNISPRAHLQTLYWWGTPTESSWSFAQVRSSEQCPKVAHIELHSAFSYIGGRRGACYSHKANSSYTHVAEV